ncbi:MAG: hypothetical protein Q4B65_00775 [Candidatus Saccharibacteria bacterium]|nr:hypothetical protein [Candidatus Saccharibacteria bacterium]
MNLIDLDSKFDNDAAWKAIPYFPQSVCWFADYLAKKSGDDRVNAEMVAGMIGDAMREISNDEIDDAKFMNYVPDKIHFLDTEAKFILQIFDEVIGGEFATKLRAECEEIYGWKPVRRAKILDRKLLNAIFPDNVVAAVEWWTTIIQLCEVKVIVEEPDSKTIKDAEDGKRTFFATPYTFLGLNLEQMSCFRYTLADHLRQLVEYEGGTIFGTGGGANDYPLLMAMTSAGLHFEEMKHALPTGVAMILDFKEVRTIEGVNFSSHTKIWEPSNK